MALMAVVVLADGNAGRPGEAMARAGASVEARAGEVRGPVGVLVDDPRCGRLLLDCGLGVTTRAAFAGVSLAGARVLPTGRGPDRIDPAVPNEAVVDLPGAVPPGVRVLPAGDGEIALLVETSRGILLHCPAAGPLPAATVAALPTRVTPTVLLSRAVRDQLAGVTVLAPFARGRRVLVTGGARSGKSELAERMFAGREQVVYLATGGAPSPDDAEWAARVARHRDRRPVSWRTVETMDAAAVLASAGQPGSPVLFDCVGTWLTAAMDTAGIWILDGSAEADAGSGASGATAATGAAQARRVADGALAEAMDALVAAWTQTEAHVVAVTNEVGSGIVPATAAGRRFRDELGRLNARLAVAADEVWLCTVGIGQRIR